MRVKSGLSIATALAVVGVAYWYTQQLPNPTSERGGPAGSVDQTTSLVTTAGPGTLRQLNYRTGEERDFSVQLRSQIGLKGQVASGGQQAMSIDLGGTLHLLVLDSDGHGAQVLARMAATTLDFIDSGKKADKDALTATTAALARGIRITYDSKGTISAFLSGTATDRFAEQLLRQVCGDLQMGMSETTNGNDWHLEEDDGTGVYRASYHVVAAVANEINLTKTKVGYSKLDQESSGSAALGLSGRATGHFTASVNAQDGWPTQVAGHEILDISVGQNGEMSSSGRSDIDFRAAGQHQLSPAALLAVRTAAVATSRLATNQQRERERGAALKSRAEGRLGGATLADLKRQTAALASVDANHRANAERAIFDKLVAFVRVNADDLRAVSASLTGLKAGDRWLRDNLSALSYVGCDNCQHLLVQQIMARSNEPDFGGSLVNLLSQAKFPSVEAEQALRQLASDDAKADAVKRNVAQLSLGTVANKLAAASDPRADRIVNDYLSQFQAAASVPAKLSALAVLGNCGTPQTLPAAESLLSDNEPSVRAAAVAALRNVAPAVADASLAKMLSDPATEVRAAAVRAFAMQTPNQASGQILASAVASESSPALRSSMILQLAPYYQMVPAARDAVDRLASSDPDPRVRVTAKNTALMYPAH